MSVNFDPSQTSFQIDILQSIMNSNSTGIDKKKILEEYQNLVRRSTDRGGPDSIETAGSDDEKLKKAVGEFTSLLLNQMFKAMRNTVPEEGLFKNTFAEEVYTGMLDTEISKLGADQNYFKSLNQLLYQQLKQKAEYDD